MAPKKRIRVTTTAPNDPIEILSHGPGVPAIVTDKKPSHPVRTDQTLEVGQEYIIKFGKGSGIDVNPEPPSFVPSDISGLQLWLDANDGLYTDNTFSTLAVSDGDPVRGWLDLSGVGNSPTSIVAAGTLKLSIKNGLSVVRFNNVSSLAKILTSPLTVPYTVFVVAKCATANINDGVDRGVFGSNDTTNWLMMYKLNSTPDKFRALGNGTGPGNIIGPAMDDNFNIWQLKINGANSEFKINNNLIGSGNCGSPAVTSIKVGQCEGANRWIGDIGEILIAENLSDANALNTYNYLSSRWNIP